MRMLIAISFNTFLIEFVEVVIIFTINYWWILQERLYLIVWLNEIGIGDIFGLDLIQRDMIVFQYFLK